MASPPLFPPKKKDVKPKNPCDTPGCKGNGLHHRPEVGTLPRYDLCCECYIKAGHPFIHDWHPECVAAHEAQEKAVREGADA